MTETHGESHPVSMRIPVSHLMTWYFTRDFPHNALLAKPPNTSTRGL